MRHDRAQTPSSRGLNPAAATTQRGQLRVLAVWKRGSRAGGARGGTRLGRRLSVRRLSITWAGSGDCRDTTAIWRTSSPSRTKSPPQSGAAIAPAIRDAEQQRALHKSAEHLDAWEAYHRGLWHWRLDRRND